MRSQYALYLQLLLLSLMPAGAKPSRLTISQRASQTTEIARKLVLQRLESIARMSDCRQAFDRQKIDLDHVRETVYKVRFYNAGGPEGDLRFSNVVGKPASPDEPIRDLAQGLSADAFVLGYQDGNKYVRTKEVVLNQGYFEQRDKDGMSRLTTDEERQALLLHEILHIALNRDDDDLNRRGLCPLRLLASCPGRPTETKLE